MPRVFQADKSDSQSLIISHSSQSLLSQRPIYEDNNENQNQFMTQRFQLDLSPTSKLDLLSKINQETDSTGSSDESQTITIQPRNKRIQLKSQISSENIVLNDVKQNDMNNSTTRGISEENQVNEDSEPSIYVNDLSKMNSQKQINNKIETNLMEFNIEKRARNKQIEDINEYKNEYKLKKDKEVKETINQTCNKQVENTSESITTKLTVSEMNDDIYINLLKRLENKSVSKYNIDNIYNSRELRLLLTYKENRINSKYNYRDKKEKLIEMLFDLIMNKSLHKVKRTTYDEEGINMLLSQENYGTQSLKRIRKNSLQDSNIIQEDSLASYIQQYEMNNEFLSFHSKTLVMSSIDKPFKFKNTLEHTLCFDSFVIQKAIHIYKNKLNNKEEENLFSSSPPSPPLSIYIPPSPSPSPSPTFQHESTSLNMTEFYLNQSNGYTSDELKMSERLSNKAQEEEEANSFMNVLKLTNNHGNIDSTEDSLIIPIHYPFERHFYIHQSIYIYWNLFYSIYPDIQLLCHLHGNNVNIEEIIRFPVREDQHIHKEEGIIENISYIPLSTSIIQYIYIIEIKTDHSLYILPFLSRRFVSTFEYILPKDIIINNIYEPWDIVIIPFYDPFHSVYISLLAQIINISSFEDYHNITVMYLYSSEKKTNVNNNKNNREYTWHYDLLYNQSYNKISSWDIDGIVLHGQEQYNHFCQNQIIHQYSSICPLTTDIEFIILLNICLNGSIENIHIQTILHSLEIITKNFEEYNTIHY
ncbi:hypothetical protein WA158_007295 [Blastocystis sp. Blastoise]